jgi:hypothetical protein
VLANVKNSLLATHRAVAAKHLPRYLGAFAWRFNRRFRRGPDGDEPVAATYRSSLLAGC